MHRAIQRGVAIHLRQPARLIAGRRCRLSPARALPLTPSRSLSLFPTAAIPPSSSRDTEADPSQTGVSPGGQESGDGSQLGNGNGGQRNGRRWRNRRSRDLAPITIPGWFLERNVKLREEAIHSPGTSLEIVSDGFQVSGATQPAAGSSTQQQASNSSAEDESARHESTTQNTISTEGAGEPDAKPYHIHQSLLAEIHASLSGGLSSFRPESLDTFTAGKTHLKLYCPIDGATYFLEKIVEYVANEVDADVIRLDAQDLAEIAGDYIKEGPEAATNSLWSLSYDALQALPKLPPRAPQEAEEGDEEGEEYGTDELGEADGRPPKPQLWGVPIMSIHQGPSNIGSIFDTVRKAAQGVMGSAPSQRGAPANTANIPGIVPAQNGPLHEASRWNDIKLEALLESLIEANVAKRSPLSENAVLQEQGVHILSPDAPNSAGEAEAQPIGDQSSEPAPKTILMIRGFKELSATDQGRLIIEKLVATVQKKRKSGQPIVIVGTSASSALAPEISHNAFVDLQMEGQQTLSRCVVVTPYMDKGAIFRDGPRRTREVNVRHIHAMIQRLFTGSGLAEGQELEAFTAEMSKHTGTAELSSLLEDQYFGFDEVHRIALAALGLQIQNGIERDSTATRAHAVVTAMQMLDQADEIKTEWARNEQQILKATPDASKAKSHTDARLKKLKKQCNHHERSLLKGVVDPTNIQTTFEHVHAPMETIESLKNLTMLSLTRPEAFKYGVLATDKMTGCLLYGPPGTGKTLLAKAVAKESGATVLEVSGSDVYDMYVGESEKNVRAIFSLAKKLSPCVVFIDEADAIFASRGSGTNRNSHRELINQFLREWDGMTDTNAFIMVATNRPFDLDDAALRRLPRRLLVDLPVEKDREAILQIHLKDESLDSNISLGDLAAKTPLYSGSDLKNMCVSAALAAVKEENDTAAKHNAEKEDEDPAFEFPERRTLQMRHFERAMEEITSSVSEDMSSLGAIRKFDEKYGDRRGKKKRGGYGFTSGGEGVKEDAAKVRL